MPLSEAEQRRVIEEVAGLQDGDLQASYEANAVKAMEICGAVQSRQLSDDEVNALAPHIEALVQIESRMQGTNEEMREERRKTILLELMARAAQ